MLLLLCLLINFFIVPHQCEYLCDPVSSTTTPYLPPSQKFQYHQSIQKTPAPEIWNRPFYQLTLFEHQELINQLGNIANSILAQWGIMNAWYQGEQALHISPGRHDIPLKLNNEHWELLRNIGPIIALAAPEIKQKQVEWPVLRTLRRLVQVSYDQNPKVQLFSKEVSQRTHIIMTIIIDQLIDTSYEQFLEEMEHIERTRPELRSVQGVEEFLAELRASMVDNDVDLSSFNLFDE